MRRALLAIAALTATTTLIAGQTPDVNEILTRARAALGGEKRLAALRTFSAAGTSTRVVGETSAAPGDAELAFELPDRFMKKETQNLGGMALGRTSGFNGDAVINVIDQPPAMAGRMIVRIGPGEAAPGQTLTPEQQEEQRARQLLASRQEFARLTLGFLLASPDAYPLQFAYGGVAESPDGKADIVDVTGEGGFAVRLFIDQATHLPLMLSWMAREPLRMTTTFARGGPGGAAPPAGGGGNVVIAGRSTGQMTPEERDKLLKDLEAQRKEAEAKLRVVEYRLYYADYREVDGIKVPFRLQQEIDGKPAEELAFERVQINRKIDPRKFDPGK